MPCCCVPCCCVLLLPCKYGLCLDRDYLSYYIIKKPGGVVLGLVVNVKEMNNNAARSTQHK